MKITAPLRVLLAGLLLATVTACGSSSDTATTGSSTESTQAVQEVGFDLDDTLVFSTPNFEQAFQSDADPFSDRFWGIINGSDAKHSCIKVRVKKILKKHQQKGREIFIITAREGHNTEPARQFVNRKFGVPRDHLYFEPDGKTKRLKQLGIDIYYGDSDSDIKDAQAGNIRAVRVKRSPKSDYEDKYHPGKYGEKVLDNTASHRCN